MKHDPREHFDADEKHAGRAGMVCCAQCLRGFMPDEMATPADFDTSFLIDAVAIAGGPICIQCAEDKFDNCADCDDVTICEHKDLNMDWLCAKCGTPDRLDPLGARTDRAWENAQ